MLDQMQSRLARWFTSGLARVKAFRKARPVSRTSPIGSHTSAATKGRTERISAIRRGVGYCENVDCPDYAKGTFLLSRGDIYCCTRCRKLGFVEVERGSWSGRPGIFKEVRVEFNFDPIHKTFQNTAIVRDESLPGDHNVYSLRSALIKTEHRALKVAEAILGNLNRHRGLLRGNELPGTTETILSLDQDRKSFSRELSQLAETWRESQLVTDHRQKQIKE